MALQHENIQSIFQMTSFSIYKAAFEVKKWPVHTPLKLKLKSFSVSLPDKLGKTLEADADVSVEMRIKSGNTTYIIVKLSIKGHFKGQNMKEEQFKEFIKYSGVSNLTQIARSYIISMTSQLGIMPPIVLPMINLVELYKSQKEK